MPPGSVTSAASCATSASGASNETIPDSVATFPTGTLVGVSERSWIVIAVAVAFVSVESEQ